VEDAVEAAKSSSSSARSSAAHVERARVLLLQARVVVVGEAVEPDDVVALLLERLGEVRADEAGRPVTAYRMASGTSRQSSTSSKNSPAAAAVRRLTWRGDPTPRGAARAVREDRRIEVFESLHDDEHARVRVELRGGSAKTSLIAST
jgi:hypothetical protein